MSYRAKDSQLCHVHYDGVLVDIILPEIRNDVLPDEDVPVPEWELPPADQESEQINESIKDRDNKWSELRTAAAESKLM